MMASEIFPLSFLEIALKQAVTQEAQRIVAEEQDAAADRVRQRLADMVDQLALSVLTQYRIERNLNEVVIRVDRKALER